MPADTRLHRNDAHGVRDDVVQFPRDAQTFLDDGLPSAFFALAFEDHGPFSQCRPASAALAQIISTEPRDDGGESDGYRARAVDDP